MEIRSTRPINVIPVTTKVLNCIVTGRTSFNHSELLLSQIHTYINTCIQIDRHTKY